MELFFFFSVPTAPPANVRGLTKSSETLEIHWDPPPEEHQNAPIIKYRIYYTRVIGRKPHRKVVGKDVRKIFLQGLGKYTKYIIWVTAENTMGISPPSPAFSIYTNEEGNKIIHVIPLYYVVFCCCCSF